MRIIEEAKAKARQNVMGGNSESGADSSSSGEEDEDENGVDMEEEKVGMSQVLDGDELDDNIVDEMAR